MMVVWPSAGAYSAAGTGEEREGKLRLLGGYSGAALQTLRCW
jgi:hypothetical protein